MINDNVSLLYFKSPKEKIPLLINILEEYGIKQNKKIYMQSFDIKSSYYVNHLISLISKINFKYIDSYMFPIGAKSNDLKNYKINANKFVEAIEKIRKSNISISTSKIYDDEDWLDYIFNYSYQVIIIDNFDKFIEKSNKNTKTIIKTINNYTKKYKAEIILFTNDIKKINTFKNFKTSIINDSFIFEYDKHNHQILNIVERN